MNILNDIVNEAICVARGQLPSPSPAEREASRLQAVAAIKASGGAENAQLAAQFAIAAKLKGNA